MNLLVSQLLLSWEMLRFRVHIVGHDLEGRVACANRFDADICFSCGVDCCILTLYVDDSLTNLSGLFTVKNALLTSTFRLQCYNGYIYNLNLFLGVVVLSIGYIVIIIIIPAMYVPLLGTLILIESVWAVAATQ